MKYCHQCGNRLVLGTELYCPACGTKQIAVNESSGNDASTATASTKISEISGDVIGSTTSGMGNIIGKEVAYSVSGNVIHFHVESISAQTIQEFKDIISRPVQLETKGDLGQQSHNIESELDAKANEAKLIKEETKQVLKDIDQIGIEKGVHIDQIKVEELQVSRTELELKDIISEGNEHYYKGEYSKAIECYDRALEINDKHVEALTNKGQILVNRDYEGAMQCYDKLLEIDNRDAKIWYMKGWILFGRNEYSEAIEYFDNALKIDSKLMAVWFYKGDALFNLGRYNEAIHCYDKMLEINDKNTTPWRSKAVALDKLGKHKEAKKYYERAKRLG